MPVFEAFTHPYRERERERERERDTVSRQQLVEKRQRKERKKK